MSFLRKAVASVESAILTSKQSLGLQLKLQQERDVFLFRNRDATRDWIASSDRSIGGLSECKWGFYGESDEKLHPDDKRGIITTVNQEDNIPSGGDVRVAVFSGRLSMACQPTEAGIIRSGYCAVRTSMPTGLLLHGYEGITMRIMTDGREYRMNAQMESWNPLNLYMGFIRTPANEWVDIEIGFAIADQKEGDFELRVQWIKAVARVENPGKDRDDEEDDDTYDDVEAKPGFKKPSDLVI
ncbi:Complex i intermediate-associated protein 30, mitochondrial precursor, partial [Globisporangium splendens]